MKFSAIPFRNDQAALSHVSIRVNKRLVLKVGCHGPRMCTECEFNS